MGERRSWLQAEDGQVRAILQQRLEACRDARPTAVLGLEPGAGSDQARAAFLESTKSYHPARFARRPDDIQRMANQLFLLIKSAYEELGSSGSPRTRRESAPPPARGRAGAQTRPPGSGRIPQVRPVLSRSGTVRMSGSLPRARMTNRSRPQAAPRSAPSPVTSRPGAEPAEPIPATPAPAAPSAPSTPAQSSNPLADLIGIPEFRRAVAACDQGEYREARLLFASLRRDIPDHPQLEAHLHFAWSGEWTQRGRPQQAIASLKRALAADPTFEPAKKALARAAAHLLKR